MPSEILALIPARSGSKSVPDKNIRLLAGKPLLAYSVEQALASRLVTRVIVSTDSAQYAELARAYGAEVPFLRPAALAQDHSTDLDVFIHALAWLREHEGYVPDLCLHLRPTCPVRRVEDIDAVLGLLQDHPDLHSVRSVSVAPETPYKMWFRQADGLLAPVVQTDIKDAYNMPRQVLPQVFLQNACIDAMRPEVVTQARSMTGERIYGYVMEAHFDIDTEQHFQRAAVYLSRRRGETSYPEEAP